MIFMHGRFMHHKVLTFHDWNDRILLNMNQQIMVIILIYI